MVTGEFYYKGARAAQHNDIFEPFRALLKSVQPARVIELGTCDGGLTLIIRDLLDEVGLQDTPLYTYDNDAVHRPGWEKFIKPLPQSSRIHFNLMSFWDGSGQLNGDIVHLITQPGTVLVLCDGGNKPREFQNAVKYVKPGDVVMGHDYAVDVTDYNDRVKNKIWNWLELQEQDIAEAANTYNLVPFMAEEFKAVVWACKRKIS